LRCHEFGTAGSQEHGYPVEHSPVGAWKRVNGYAKEPGLTGVISSVFCAVLSSLASVQHSTAHRVDDVQEQPLGVGVAERLPRQPGAGEGLEDDQLGAVAGAERCNLRRTDRLGGGCRARRHLDVRRRP
jgi:hypothetical protein